MLRILLGQEMEDVGNAYRFDELSRYVFKLMVMKASVRQRLRFGHARRYEDGQPRVIAQAYLFCIKSTLPR
jgi:hypothetical protein